MTLRAGGSALAVLLLVGCAPRETRVVSIDRARILKPTPAVRPAPRLPAVPGSPPVTVTLPGRPGRVLPAAQGATREEIAARLIRARDTARANLAERLRRFYEREAVALRLNQERARGKAAAERAAEAEALLRERFEVYAAKKGPLQARLAVLTSFPDPGPPALKPEIPAVQRVLREAQEIREQIATLDAAFDREARAILAGLESATDEERARDLLALERFRDELQRRANREARLSIDVELDKLPETLLRRSELRVPPVGGRSASVPGLVGLPPGPRVDVRTAQAERARANAALDRDLQIWSAWENVEIRPGAPDATERFIQWRNSHHPR